MNPAPQGSLGHAPRVGVPYHTMSTRPEEPAATHGKTFVCRPATWLETLIGLLQVFPWLVEIERKIVVAPITAPDALTGDCAQATYRFPPLSIAIVAKSCPLLTV